MTPTPNPAVGGVAEVAAIIIAAAEAAAPVVSSVAWSAEYSASNSEPQTPAFNSKSPVLAGLFRSGHRRNGPDRCPVILVWAVFEDAAAFMQSIA
jgi:hypothetical protein